MLLNFSAIFLLGGATGQALARRGERTALRAKARTYCSLLPSLFTYLIFLTHFNLQYPNYTFSLSL